MQLPTFGRLRALKRRFRRAGEEDAADADALEAVADVVTDDARDVDDVDAGDTDAHVEDGVPGARARWSRLSRSAREHLGALTARLRRRRADGDDEPVDDVELADAGDDDDGSDDAGRPKRARGVAKLRGTVGLLVRKDRLLVTRGSGKKATVDEYPFEPGHLGDIVAQLRDDGMLGGQVVCSIEGRRLYTVTRADDPEHEGLGPSEILARDIGRLAGGIVADSEEVKLPAGVHHTYAACPGEVARELWRGLAGLRPRDLRLVPTDHAVHRAAVDAQRSPRRWRKELRVIVDGARGLALVAWHGQVVASRAFVVPADAPPETRARAIEIAVHGLVTWSREEFGIEELDGGVLHAEDEGPVAEAVDGLVHGELLTASPIGLDSESLALALPAMARKRLPDDLDVFRDLHAPSGFKENFPVRAAALMLTTLAFCSWLVWDEVTRLENELSAINGQLGALVKRLDIKRSDVPKLHEVRTIEWNTVTAFVGERVFWSDLLDELPSVLPEGVVLNDLDGRDRVMLKKSTAGGAQAPRRLLITGKVDVDDESVAPPEVGLITDALRSSEEFRTTFPRITGANVKMMPGPNGLYARMTFTCLPGNG